MYLKPLTFFSTSALTPSFNSSNIVGLFGLEVLMKVNFLLFSIVLGWRSSAWGIFNSFRIQFNKFHQDNCGFLNPSVALSNICFWQLFSTSVHISPAITNMIFFKQCFRWLVEYGGYRFVSVSLWCECIHIPLLSRFIKSSRKGISFSLNYMVNWIVSLT